MNSKKSREILDKRECVYCYRPVDFHKFNKDHGYLKIHELKEEWYNLEKLIFCGNLYQRKYYKALFRHDSKDE
ncbi:MAG: hypothetical protein ACFFAS_09585 [Promethearchaeota archaeon]